MQADDASRLRRGRPGSMLSSAAAAVVHAAAVASLGAIGIGDEGAAALFRAAVRSSHKPLQEGGV